VSFEPSPLFVKTCDLLAWLVPITLQFPKSQRFVLAQRLQDAALDLHERLVAAGKTQRAERRRNLLEADIRLEQLRLHWRLCRTLNIVEPGRYEHGARLIDAVGRLLGGCLAAACYNRDSGSAWCRGGSWYDHPLLLRAVARPPSRPPASPALWVFGLPGTLLV
jgi:hypothetical protein